MALEGAAALIAAVVFVVRAFAGADQHVVSGFGNAAWFAVIGAAVLAAGWALWTGRRWGRGIAVFAQLLLLPVTWYIGVGSHQWFYAVPIAAVAVMTLVLLFSPATLQWLTGSATIIEERADQAGHDSSANADNSGPETR